MPKKQVFGKLTFTRKLARAGQNGASRVCFNVSDLTNGKVHTGFNYEFTHAVKVRELLSLEDARYFTENGKELGLKVTGSTVKAGVVNESQE